MHVTEDAVWNNRNGRRSTNNAINEVFQIVLEQVIKKKIDRQFVGGVLAGVNTVVGTLEMKQNQDNCSDVREFVRTRVTGG